MQCVVLIAAGGVSNRYKSSGGVRPKLEEDLAGRSVLTRTVEAFTRRPEVEAIFVAAPPDDPDYERFTLRHGDQLAFHGVTIVRGGDTRAASVRQMLESIGATTSATHAAIHDAARPLVSAALLDRLFDAAANHAAVIPGVPVTDTIKRVTDAPLAQDDPVDALLGDAGKVNASLARVEETLDREALIAVQTPQVFELDLLRRAHAGATDATDDAALVEALGEPVLVVEGDPTNIKITRLEDLRLAAALLDAN